MVKEALLQRKNATFTTEKSPIFARFIGFSVAHIYRFRHKRLYHNVLTCIIHRRFYCESQLPVRQQSARSSSLEVGFTTSGIVIAVLSLTHRHLELS